ncbi:hypothetical protein RB653_004456 [Dictyostelium firmibasis]|uniref:Uncharacterized protein n=1 Tax=Dictyostelium firmibasis TaxID=79012 RepID=A0AAN7U6C6_9MYCE
MWISKINRAYDHMNGLFLFYKPILRNPYFVLEKQNTNYLITDKRFLPKEYFSNKNFQVNNKNDDNNESTKDQIKNFCKILKDKNIKGIFKDFKEKQILITKNLKENEEELKNLHRAHNQQPLPPLNENDKKAMEQFGLPGNDIMVPFSSLTSNGNNDNNNDTMKLGPREYSFFTKLWIRAIPYVPVSWLLKSNESYRIISTIDPLEPTLIATSSNFKDIQHHWHLIDKELYNSLKVLPTTFEKNHRLDSFLNIKLHSFPTHVNK